MNASVIEAYIEFNKKSILSYNNLLLKYLNIDKNLLKHVSIEKVDKIVCEYWKKKYSSDTTPEVVNIDLEIMLSLPKKRHQDLNLIMSMLGQQIINLKELENNDSLVRLYKILSNSIFIAIELNNRTCSIANNDFSFKKAISSILEKYGNYLEKEVVLVLNQSMPVLKDECTNNNRIIKKLVKHYNTSKVDFEGYELVNTLDLYKIFQIIPKYDFEKLKLNGKRKISTIVSQQKYYKDIFFILLDKLNYEILKNLVQRKNVSNYIVSLPNDFLKTKTNISRIIKLLDSSYSKKHICLEIEYSQLKKYMEHFDRLKSNGISIIISNIGKQYSKEVLENVCFVSLNSDNLNDEKLLKLVKNNHMTVIYNTEISDDYPKGIGLIRNINNSKMISKEKMS